MSDYEGPSSGKIAGTTVGAITLSVIAWIVAHALLWVILMIFIGLPIFLGVLWYVDAHPGSRWDSGEGMLDLIGIVADWIALLIFATVVTAGGICYYQGTRDMFSSPTHEEMDQELRAQALAKSGRLELLYKLHPEVDPMVPKEEQDRIKADIARRTYGRYRRQNGEWWALDYFSDPPPNFVYLTNFK